MRVLAMGFVAVLPVLPLAALDLPELKARGVLRAIVAEQEQPETFALTPAEQPGFERELLELFAGRQGLRLAPVTVKSHAGRVPALLNDQGDLIVAIFDTPERRESVDFTSALMPTYNVAVSCAPQPAPMSLPALLKLRVGVLAGTQPAEEALAAGLPPARLVKFESDKAMFAALQKGSLGAVVMPVSEFALSARHMPGLQAGVEVGPTGRVAWAVRKQDDQLEQALDEFLGTARRSGTWSRLIVKYFGDQALKVLGRERLETSQRPA